MRVANIKTGTNYISTFDGNTAVMGIAVPNTEA
jgi:hypothetical protein